MALACMSKLVGGQAGALVLARLRGGLKPALSLLEPLAIDGRVHRGLMRLRTLPGGQPAVAVVKVCGHAPPCRACL